jgi:hypothetical protein
MKLREAHFTLGKKPFKLNLHEEVKIAKKYTKDPAVHHKSNEQ